MAILLSTTLIRDIAALGCRTQRFNSVHLLTNMLISVICPGQINSLRYVFRSYLLADGYLQLPFSRDET
jgi:hypothetical protein